MNRSLLCLVALGGALACTTVPGSPPAAVAAAPAAEEAAVRAVLAEWLTALEQNDMPALERIIAPDYLITAEGRVMDRTEDLAVIRTGRVKFQTATTDSVLVRI